jgi:hypothetical protein
MRLRVRRRRAERDWGDQEGGASQRREYNLHLDLQLRPMVTMANGHMSPC